MPEAKAGQTDPNAPAGASGSSANGAPSSPGATGKKSYEELEAEASSLRASVLGMSAQKEQWEVDRKAKVALEQEIADLNARNGRRDGAPAAGAKEEDDLLSPEEVAAIDRRIDARVEARERAKQTQLEEQRKQSLAFASKRKDWLAKAEKEFPDSLKPGTSLFKRAQEIYTDPTSELSTLVEVEGQKIPVPASAHAEYDAIARASAELQTKGASETDRSAGAGFAGTGGNGGSGSGPQSGSGELSDEEYLALSPEQKSKYQEERFGRKFSGRK